jgi:hypothetical protein
MKSEYNNDLGMLKFIRPRIQLFIIWGIVFF